MGTTEFEQAARRFAAAVEAAESADTVARTLAGLYAVALESLREVGTPGEQEIPAIPQSSWQQQFDAMTRLLQKTWYHDIVTDRFNLSSDPRIATGDLADDVADTWREVKAGLMALEAGVERKTVDWHWAFSFRSHWGTHAVSAIKALHDSLSAQG